MGLALFEPGDFFCVFQQPVLSENMLSIQTQMFPQLLLDLAQSVFRHLSIPFR